ncbi:DNA mismatch repair endonuclease MutL [Legionella spiritensis]|uniref:DNA mismatch repair protein MutL n=1 Tax=Legionella spiritensis TaxID=452 RepID=A0A0W0Z5J1_LEGSP|nr:DNA mismatch repair endonuclease MutL [Legionella spiritensis]KTD64381.1 DNA mismatch repair protein MutL [Legionella spiritensis]SNV46198.1 DNA mismatch repair protein MutL [Legionella spiritensis]
MVVRIQQLSSEVANQIAAGEVIERPASVVKELLENAADARSTSIIVDIGFGGLNQIKVSDNGVGIVADDLPLAIAAHATSKISRLSDIYALGSLGFRGEALASIASVSRIMISSKPAQQEHAMMLSMVDGSMQLTPCARNQGTTIDVRDIFYNAPVRKKFLKSEKNEFQAIESVVRRFAMSAPEIAIQLNHNGKPQLKLPQVHTEQALHARMIKLLGKAFGENAIYLNVEHAGLGLRGWLSQPQYQRSQNDKQWFYINGRMVKDKLVHHAVKQAYEQVIHPGKHPAVLLYFTIDPEQMDVNVHPTKHEVRFQQPRLVHDFIMTQIQQALNRASTASVACAMREPVYDRQDWSVREMSGLSRLDPETLMTNAPEHNVLMIDRQYIVFKEADRVYLANWTELQKLWMREELFNRPLPLESRPLLVPINYKTRALSIQDGNAYCKLLVRSGLKTEWINHDQLVIHSIPVIIPDLNINSFLTQLFSIPMPSIEQLLTIMVDNQSAPPCFDQAILNAYLGKHAGKSLSETSFCKLLTASLCRELMDG